MSEYTDRDVAVNYEVIAEHKASFPYSVELKMGDTVTVTDREEDGCGASVKVREVLEFRKYTLTTRSALQQCSLIMILLN